MSATVRRRRRTVEERIGAQLRHGKPGDLQGRGEPLKRDRGAIVSRAGGPSGGDSGTVIEHLTAYATAGQTIADAGQVMFDREAAPPTERRGFRTFSARLAADGEVGDIPVDVRGFALVNLRLPFVDDVTATCTIQRVRGGLPLTIVEATGTGPSVNGGKGFWVAPGDKVRVVLTSDSDVTLSDSGDDPQIEIAVWSFAAITSTLTGDYEATVLADTPLGYWKLDEASGTTAADASGNGNDGAYSGSYTLGATGVMQDGSAATAVTFSDGSAAMGDLASFEFPGTAAFTAEAWVRLTSVPDDDTEFYQVVAKLPTGGGGGSGWELYFTGDGSGGAVAAFARTDGTTYTSVVHGGLTSATDYHVVGTYDGTTLRLYINGAEVATAASAVSLAANSAALEIGKQSIEDPMAGAIDEVAVYDRALSASEVSEHYAVGTRAA